MELADKLPPKLGALIRKLVRIKLAICAIATLILPVTFFFVVIFRYGFNMDLFAYEEWLLPISFWLYFLASAVGSYEDSQIRADILETFFKTARATWVRKVVVSIIENCISIVIVYWATLMLINEISSYPNWQSTIALQIPYIVPRLGIFIGLLFMAVYGLLHLYVLLKFGVAIVEENQADGNQDVGAV